MPRRMIDEWLWKWGWREHPEDARVSHLCLIPVLREAVCILHLSIDLSSISLSSVCLHFLRLMELPRLSSGKESTC